MRRMEMCKCHKNEYHNGSPKNRFHCIYTIGVKLNLGMSSQD